MKEFLTAMHRKLAMCEEAVATNFIFTIIGENGREQISAGKNIFLTHTFRKFGRLPQKVLHCGYKNELHYGDSLV